MGRPSIYSEELATRICELVATHPYGLPKLCAMFPELPTRETINVWRWNKKDFSDKYAEAKRFQAEMMVESFEDILDETQECVYDDEAGVKRVDNGIISQARLKIDTRKWTASKLAPKIYGDQKQVEELQSQNERYLKELQELKAQLDAKNRKEY